ncbi:MAG: SAM-dependent chlorinase/fluorinase [Chloroherpetonaceae bacterium]|nr:SAM-dependent chlorinase/fluorinase [Chthonomonadaceae bacterium]MDW8209234.1 SAM-dependent chlorinase/fluorinase [Chloroherpetonaceae bacterium]
MSPIIALMTDFGLSDTYVGTMKGVILCIAPGATIVDLTHGIGPQNLLEASLKLASVVAYFPPETVYVVVVDPGVGSQRDAVIVETAIGRFVCPNNGVLTQVLRTYPPLRVVRLTEKARPYCLPEISATFHGRDIFAPVGAHLAQGVPMETFGDPCASESLVTCDIPAVDVASGPDGRIRLSVPILYPDHFGNLITALTVTQWLAWVEHSGRTAPDVERDVQISAGDMQWQGIVRTYSDVARGAPVAYWGSSHHLEIGIREGNAVDTLHLRAGDSVTVTLYGLPGASP